MTRIQLLSARSIGLSSSLCGAALGIGLGLITLGLAEPREGLRQKAWNWGLNSLMTASACAVAWGYGLEQRSKQNH